MAWEGALKSQSLLLTALGHCFWFWREGSESSHAAQAGFQKSHLIAACLGLGFTGALSTQIKNQNNDIQTELEEHLGLGVHSHIPPQQTAPSRCAGGCPNQPCRG